MTLSKCHFSPTVLIGMSGTNGSGPTRAPLGERLLALRNERGFTSWQKVADKLEERGIHATESGLSAIATGRYKNPRPAHLNALCELLEADIAQFPEWWRAKAHLALGDGENKLVRYDKPLEVEAIEDVLRATRLVEAGGPAAGSEAIRRTVPAPRPRRRAASQPKTG